MSDFKPIETQEQFDEAIKDRVNRERDTMTKKYEGFISPEEFKNKTAEMEKKISDSAAALNEANGKIANHAKELADRDTKIKAYETDSVKNRIAHEFGLSYEAIGFLRGEDEDSIKKSAESLKNLVGASSAPPLADLEGKPKGGDAALLGTIRNLKKGE